MSDKLTTEDGFARYREPTTYHIGQTTLNGVDEMLKSFPSFQRQLAEFLDREDVVKAVTKAIESER